MPQLSRYRKESPVATSASLRLRCNDRTRPGCGIRNLGAWTTPSSANSGAVSLCCLRSPSLQGGEDVTATGKFDCCRAEEGDEGFNDCVEQCGSGPIRDWHFAGEAASAQNGFDLRWRK